MNIYTQAKDLFIDNIDSLRFINLDKSKIAYQKILNIIDKPLKLVLFYGKPGSGKTYLLNKIYDDLKRLDKKVVFFQQPFYSEEDFFSTLYENLFGVKKNITSYTDFINFYKSNFDDEKLIVKENAYFIMLDEAQMYPEILIEKIRLLSDTRMFKFLFTVHKTIAKEDILAQSHFNTRIWESIELSDSTASEVTMYILKKLEYMGFNFDYDIFTKQDYKFIAKICSGNLRNVNKLMYRVFELYEYYKDNKPNLLINKSYRRKILEMAAIDRGFLSDK